MPSELLQVWGYEESWNPPTPVDLTSGYNFFNPSWLLNRVAAFTTIAGGGQWTPWCMHISIPMFQC